MNLTYVVDDASGIYLWKDEENILPGKGLQKIKEFSIYKLFADSNNNFLKSSSERNVLIISEEPFYKLYPHMLLLKEFYKTHNKIRESMKNDFVVYMNKLL
jgi:hypothetical protein